MYNSEQYKSKQTAAIQTTPLKATPNKKILKRRLTPKKHRDIPEHVYYDGIRFPANLYTPSAVAKVMAQEPGKLNASQLRQAKSNEQAASSNSNDTRQLKEAVFLERTKERAETEARNRLRW